MNWPIGSGKEFKGVYDRDKKHIISFEASGGQHQVAVTEVDPPTCHLTALSARISTQLSAMISSFWMAQAMSLISKR